ncbi:hypothetical protein [uncultured Clostridium sp.]|uniref:hypothetical protein n=1 Tax=uncultured Clostridium sp. TaxID=59620 RepID=UPI00262D5F64|nr:hypothetical protein [uncultured Clostridium sp.]
MGVLKSVLEKIFYNEKEKELTLNIPKKDFYRTELLCKCIEDDIEDDFLIEHFLMCLYLDFIRDCIKVYNLEKVYKILKEDYKNRDKKICISNGSKNVEVILEREKCIRLNITMEKKSMVKGELILMELKEEFGIEISFEELLEKLWIGFIREYKSKNSKITYNYLIKIIERIV